MRKGKDRLRKKRKRKEKKRQAMPLRKGYDASLNMLDKEANMDMGL